MEVDVALIERTAYVCDQIAKKLASHNENLLGDQPAKAERLSTWLEYATGSMNGLKEKLEALAPIWCAIKAEQATRIKELTDEVAKTNAELSTTKSTLSSLKRSHDSLTRAYADLNSKFDIQQHEKRLQALQSKPAESSEARTVGGAQLWVPPKRTSSGLWEPPAKSRRITDYVHTPRAYSATSGTWDVVHSSQRRIAASSDVPLSNHAGKPDSVPASQRDEPDSRANLEKAHDDLVGVDDDPLAKAGGSDSGSPNPATAVNPVDTSLSDDADEPDVISISSGDLDEHDHGAGVRIVHDDSVRANDSPLAEAGGSDPRSRSSATAVGDAQPSGYVPAPLGGLSSSVVAGSASTSGPQAISSLPADTRARDLRALFHLDWQPTIEEDRRIDAMIARKFAKESSLEAKMKRIDQHVVGILTGKPPYPRPCLWAQLLGGKEGTGDRLMHNCEFCKVQRYRDDAICVWAEYVLDVQDGFLIRGPHGKVMSRTDPMKVASEKDWARPQANLTMPFNGTNVRWILKRRAGRLPGT